MILALALLFVPQQALGGEWTILHELDGPNDWAACGTSLARLGDVDFDGIEDFAVGCPEADTAFGDEAGRVDIHSGATGAIVFSIDAFAHSEQLGLSCGAAGDVDLDGVPDVLAGAPSAGWNGQGDIGYVRIMSSLTWGEIRTLRGDDYGFGGDDEFGFSAAGIDDCDGDGVPDVVVGVPGETHSGGNGSVLLISGATGLEIHRVDARPTEKQLGWSVAALGDTNGDSVPDYVIGAPGSDLNGLSGCGGALLVSGADASILQQWAGPHDFAELGKTVSGAGDVDGDGAEDVMLGSPAYFSASQGIHVGAMAVNSGATGDTILFVEGHTENSNFGFALAPAGGDVDGDGGDDLLVGAWNEDDPQGGTSVSAIHVVSPTAGRVVMTRFGFSGSSEFGIAIASCGDANGDGLVDVISGAPSQSGPNGVRAGKTFVLSAASFLTADTSELSASGGALVGTIDFPDSEGGLPYALLASGGGVGPQMMNGIWIPLTADSIFTRTTTGWAPPYVTGNVGTLDAGGGSSFTIASDPALAAAVGSTFYLAVVSLDAGTLQPRQSSIARAMTITP